MKKIECGPIRISVFQNGDVNVWNALTPEEEGLVLRPEEVEQTIQALETYLREKQDHENE